MALLGILITYRRKAELRETLRRLADQTIAFDELMVVDNGNDPEVAVIVEELGPSATTYLPSPHNAGPAGAAALAMTQFLKGSTTDDWIALLDDDDPPLDPGLFEQLYEFARMTACDDAMTGAVGLMGAKFDWRFVRLLSPTDADLSGPVAVDYLASGRFPLYRASAIRSVGVMNPALFFGYEEVELGLRLRRSGYNLYVHGSLAAEYKRAQGLLGTRGIPYNRAPSLWRRYYGTRNLFYIAREYGGITAPAKVALFYGILSPLRAWLFRRDGTTPRALPLSLRACVDGWRGHLGRSIDHA